MTVPKEIKDMWVDYWIMELVGYARWIMLESRG